MKRKNTWVAIIHLQGIHLYTTDKKNISYVGCMDTVTLRTYAQQHSIDFIHVFDNGPEHIAKLEKADESMTLQDFFAWYRHKKLLFKEDLYRRILFSIRMRSMVTLESQGLPENTVQGYGIYSYPYTLCLIMRTYVNTTYPTKHTFFLVIMDHHGRVIMAFFIKKKMVFLRIFSSFSSEKNTKNMENSIMDSVRYINKIFNIAVETKIFCHENASMMFSLQQSFPEAICITPEELRIFSGWTQTSDPPYTLYDHMMVQHMCSVLGYRLHTVQTKKQKYLYLCAHMVMLGAAYGSFNCLSFVGDEKPKSLVDYTQKHPQEIRGIVKLQRMLQKMLTPHYSLQTWSMDKQHIRFVIRKNSGLSPDFTELSAQFNAWPAECVIKEKKDVLFICCDKNKLFAYCHEIQQ